MKTLQQFIATRTVCADLGLALRDEDLMGQRGWLYVDCLYIIEGAEGPWTMLDRDGYAGELSAVEAQLYLWACREGYCDEVLP